MNQRVLEVYKRVMALPEGPTSQAYRKELRRQVRVIPDEIKQDILSRADAIDVEAEEAYQAKVDILTALGFTESEAYFYGRCRLNSPGIRTLVTERVNITRYAKPNEIKLINDGDIGVLRILARLYIKGGIT